MKKYVVIHKSWSSQGICHLTSEHACMHTFIHAYLHTCIARGHFQTVQRQFHVLFLFCLSLKVRFMFSASDRLDAVSSVAVQHAGRRAQQKSPPARDPERQPEAKNWGYTQKLYREITRKILGYVMDIFAFHTTVTNWAIFSDSRGPGIYCMLRVHRRWVLVLLDNIQERSMKTREVLRRLLLVVYLLMVVEHWIMAVKNTLLLVFIFPTLYGDTRLSEHLSRLMVSK